MHRKCSYYNYIYEISHENALAYLQAGAYFEEKEEDKDEEPEIDKKIIAAGKLVDSFPSHQKFERTLPTGYYLFVYAYEHKLRSSVEMVMPYQVHILNNETDF